MSDERKKKLEAIRKRKNEFQKLLNAQTSQTTQSNPAIPESSQNNPSSRLDTSASESSSAPPSKPISTNPSFRPLPIKRISIQNEKIYSIKIKKINQSLRTCKSEHHIKGIPKDRKTEETQYVLPKEFEEEIKQEELLIQQNEKAKRSSSIYAAKRSSVVQSTAKDKWGKVKLLQLTKNKLKEEIKNAEEKNKFYKNNETNLKNYLENKFTLMNQALSVNDIFDICNTYYNEEESNINVSKKTLATHLCDLYDDQSSGRIVTALDWSPNQNDLFLASFSGTEDFIQQSGLIQLWSLSNRKVPDYVINYQTEITSAIFYKDNPNIVIGGSMTGQIILWDIKSGRAAPEQKSPLGIGTVKDDKVNNLHKFPVHCLAVCGKDKNIISLSTDGVLCEWSLSNLSKPINKYDISLYRNDEQQEPLNEIGPLCIGTIQNKNCNEFIIGCDRNDIYNIRLYENDYEILNSFTYNDGPIFSVCPHPSMGESCPDFSDLFLSCGADWSTKLWSSKIPNKPLITFNQSKDYVYSAKWNPINPYIFATGDGSGNIDLWDLNRDREIPTFRYNLKNAINKLAWSYDGKKLAAGDINGHISIFSSEKDVVNVKGEDISKFYKIIESLKDNYMKKTEDINQSS